MKQNYSLTLYLCLSFLLVLALSACRPGFSLENLSFGEINPNNYIAIGDGYSAGFSNTGIEPRSLLGLYPEAQINAFPALINKQFMAIRSNIPFEQHLTTDLGSGYFELIEAAQFDCPTNLIQTTLEEREASISWVDAPELPVYESLNNWGIPHMKVSTITQPLPATSDQFFKRMTPEGVQADTYLAHLQDLQPTFFTIWLGTRDVMEFAVSGGSNPAFPLTSAKVFANNLATLLDSLFSEEQEMLGVIGNIPDVTDFPFFHYIPSDYKNPEICNEEEKPLYILRSSSPQEPTPAINSDYILIVAENEIGRQNGRPGSQGLHPENPLPDQFVLDFEEANQLRAMTERYNSIIDSLVTLHNEGRSKPNLAIADLYGLFQRLHTTGITQDGLTLSSDYLVGSVFALDGLYLTTRGHALVASAFIDVMNGTPTWKARLPLPDITEYQGVVFP